MDAGRVNGRINLTDAFCGPTPRSDTRALLNLRSDPGVGHRRPLQDHAPRSQTVRG